jgi:hypothetical protein
MAGVSAEGRLTGVMASDTTLPDISKFVNIKTSVAIGLGPYRSALG